LHNYPSGGGNEAILAGGAAPPFTALSSQRCAGGRWQRKPCRQGLDTGGYLPGPLDGAGLALLLKRHCQAVECPCHLASVMFQGGFAIITPAPTIGAIAVRMRFPAFLAFILLWAAFV